MADADLDALVARARAALDGEAPAASAGDGRRFVGSAADGLATAEVAVDGTVRSLVLDPKMLKLPLDDIAVAARTAINNALDARPGEVDYAPVIATVRAAQDQARREMGAITQRMAEVAQHVRAARGGTN